MEYIKTPYALLLAKKGEIIKQGNNYYFILSNGNIIENSENSVNIISLKTAKTFRENSIRDNGFLAEEAFDLGVKLIKPYLDGGYCYGL